MVPPLKSSPWKVQRQNLAVESIALHSSTPPPKPPLVDAAPTAETTTPAHAKYASADIHQIPT